MKRKSTKLTDEAKEFIVANCKGTTCRQMATLVEQKFGGIHTYDQMQGFYYQHDLHSGIDGKFKKNSTPYNKGLPMVEWADKRLIDKLRATQFKKGRDNGKSKEINTKIIRTNGYAWIKTAEGKWENEANIVWRQYNGEIPKDCSIIHLDRNKLNNSIDNLAIVRKKEMLEITAKIGLTDDKELNKAIINLGKFKTKIREKENENV